MMKLIILLLILFFKTNSFYANDGAFFAKGNQLIPISDTDISVKKEILSLKKIRNQYLEVSVYYEFFNPKEAKKIRMGFEAFSPIGDVEGAPKNGHHPYMHDFTVDLNKQILNYEIAYVKDSTYAQKGQIKSINLENYEGKVSGNEVDFYYVYHFEAQFKKGLNIVKHTYKYNLSQSVEYHYDFEYVLSAANRWSNKQIDDFTLIIDNGDFETFCINKTFFSSENEWLINGIGKTQEIKGNPNSFIESDATKFHIQNGTIIFQKMNFKITGDLFLYAQNYFGHDQFQSIPFSFYQVDQIPEPTNDFERKVLKNLPFARRGFVFKSQDLNNYFQKIDWYIPNPNYEANIDLLNEKEIIWIEKWK